MKLTRRSMMALGAALAGLGGALALPEQSANLLTALRADKTARKNHLAL